MLLWFLLLFVRAVAASIYLGFPFSEQLPNVARVDQSYTFTMANTTYKSSDGTVSYSASNLPKWLSFDSGSRTFTGTPSNSDVGTFEITLAGTDSSDGSTISNNYSMIVSDDKGLHLSSPDVMFTQIARYGDTNGNDGLVVKQGQQFSLKFDSSVFESDSGATRSIVAYYGRSQDRGSLPNWINFDSNTLTFSGTVPYVTSENAPSVEYGFSFIASDYKGYAGSEGIFKLVVGGHQLSTSLNETIKLNGTLRSEIDEQVPILSSVFLDGNHISRDNISTAYGEDLPDYLHFNSDNFTITGEFPDKSTFDNFTIIVHDVYGNSVELPYSIDAIGSVFTVKDLPDVNATRGQFFSYQLMKSIFTDYNDTKVSVALDNASWLTYHQDNMTFNGMTPKKFDSVTAKITAESDYDEETKSLNINGVDKTTTSSSSSASATSSSSPSSTSTSSSAPVSSHKKASGVNRKALAIGLGVGIPGFLLLLAALIFLICLCRRRRNTHNDSDNPEADMSNTTATGFAANEKGTSEDTARQAGVLGALKTNMDANSTSSSITHVDSHSDEDRYYDAAEKPLKSWRADDVSDDANGAAAANAALYRVSNGSMSTVNTEQLFSVRLIDDNSYRQSNQSSLPAGQFMSNGSLNALLNRSDSGNFQRIDSDGNIITSPNQSPKKKLSRSPSENLHVLMEESGSRDVSGSSHNKQTLEPQDRPSGSSSFQFLNRFNGSEPNSSNPSASSSDQQISQSLVGDFKATRHQDGTFQWLDNSRENLVPESPPISPVKARPVSQHSNGSRISINNYVGNKAKLVDFTRKGSLRESAYEPDYQYHEESAQIQNDSD
ncbi:Axial budding pattern protein 2 [Meyerozyma sp. JA9]|nr:Axial budding pattern protein 2 [Meyerozyma sp. JA9]